MRCTSSAWHGPASGRGWTRSGPSPTRRASPFDLGGRGIRIVSRAAGHPASVGPRRELVATPSDTVSDVELLEAWRAGDERAGNQLFDRYFGRLVRFFRNKVSTGIEDLVQDTMLACVRGRDRIRDDAGFRGYLFGTARHLLYRWVSERSRREFVDFEQEAIADLVSGVSTAFAKRREERLLLEALRRVPVVYQVALELYYWEGLSGPELAEALDVPLGTARARVRRGSAQLREAVGALAENPALLESTLGGLEQWLGELREACARIDAAGTG